MTTIDTTEIGTYRRLFDNKFGEIQELLDDLPAAALGWLIAHNISSTVYLLRRVEWQVGRRAWEDVDGDEGSEEFGPANHDPAYLAERARRAQSWIGTFLDSLSGADLETSRPHPKSGRPLTVRYDIQHAIEHMSQHNGHAQLTRQLWALA